MIATQDLLTLTCPSCGAKLNVTDQIHLLVCRNCGNEHMVVRNAEMMYLTPMAQDVRHIRVGVDKTAAELAVVRLTKEVDELRSALGTAQSTKIDDWIRPGLKEQWFPIFGISSILIAVIGVANSSPPLAFLMAIIAIATLGTYKRSKNNRVKSATALKQSEINRLQVATSDKSASLLKNRRIAES